MDLKHSTHLPALPPELWLRIFHHATHAPGTLVPDIYDNASLIGPIYTKAATARLREALITKRALVRVCRRWYHLAISYLYRSVYIGRTRCLSSLSGALAHSVVDQSTIVSARPLGEYTERLDIAIRDHAENANAEFHHLAALITHMPHLVIVSFSIAANYAGSGLANDILGALLHSAESLRVLDWSSTQSEPLSIRIVDLLANCTQLRILNCPKLAWSKELQHSVIPSSVTTLRLRTLIPSQRVATCGCLLPNYGLDTICRPGPSALRELIIDLYQGHHRWIDFLHMYGSQLLSVQFYIPTGIYADVNGHLCLIASACPNLRRLTITFNRYSSFVQPHFVFPSISYLGLRAMRSQAPKQEFEMLFTFPEQLRSTVPSLQVVQLLNEKIVRCLLKTHAKLAARALQSFSEASRCRLEDEQGVPLTGQRRSLMGCLYLD